MSEVQEIISVPATPRPATVAPTPPSPPVGCPPTQYNSASLARSPLLDTDELVEPPLPLPPPPNKSTPRSGGATPRMSLTPRFISPLGSPIRRALHLTKLDPQDAWLPITESRNGNAYYAAFHTLCTGIGVQALALPVAFTILGWAWGAICLTITFIWQLYTLWALVHLHESTETGMRYSRYLDLCCATFGDKLGNWLSLFPIMYLSGGTCVTLIIIGGSTANIFFQLACGATCSMKPLTAVEWYLVFTCAVVVLCQLPNLNSIAGVSLVGAITAVGYCTSMWVVSLVKGRLPGVSYHPVSASNDVAKFFLVLNGLGIIAFAFRGHNLILEIQGTMPSSEKYPSHVPMWKGLKVAYLLIALCLFPLAIAGYWAYGHLIPNGGMLSALFQFHSRDLSKPVLELICLFIIINALSSFQIYGMPVIDHMESHYTSRMKKPCSWWIRSLIRAMFTFGSFFFAVAIPFLGSLAGLLGGIALPVTLAFPCFMWLKMKKPKKYSGMWWLNWGLGLLGVGLTVFVIAGGVYVVITTGIKVSFFKPAV
ncbi:hypothetical protein HYC85_002085 [Camellia sinensis]|uniref:Amino acid transporter transmembrane domain-containing protein n=1 Tax=Camellia sinensis TaxID=4442 RepID=A0A7J7I8J1_CAMSI|nr:hypothetical protein HYC85_002085 [Camellia sinensis]